MVLGLTFYIGIRILSAIDAGSDAGGPKGRLWTIDPIDGTLGFLRKEQYAVCLALIVDGEVEVGVLAAPNLGVRHIHDKEEGVLFLAVKGEGSWSVREQGTRRSFGAIITCPVVYSDHYPHLPTLVFTSRHNLPHPTPSNSSNP